VNQEQAKEHIEELRGFYSHLASYVAVNCFLLAINLMNWEGELWVLYPAGGWGIGMVCHAFSVFFSGSQWQERKMQELTGWTATQDELDRLSERTEALISILSSVDWKAIDPDLLQSKENLLKAQHKIFSMQANGEAANDSNKDDVVRELEVLEAFVTSSKFSYYDQASRDPKA
jgi:hypothetical protein